jgi:serine/threonine protein kinase
MGEVYRALDTRLGREVAIKFIPRHLAQDACSVERFKREARAASALSHPNTCLIYDVGEYDGQPYLVMELLQGRTLKARLADGPLSAADLAVVALQIAAALEAAHAKGIIHRDVTPANVFLTDDGSAKILDFGIAKLVAEPTEHSMQTPDPNGATADYHITLPGMFLGTAAYMSPERIRSGAADARSDLFSLGVLLYQSATGVLPFRGDSPAAVCAAVVSSTPAAPRKINPKLDRDLERIILTALERDPARRYQSAAQVAADVERRKRRLKRSVWRRQFALSAVAAAAITAVVTWATSILVPPDPPEIRLRQITTDTENKTWPVVSDGSQIYYFSFPRSRTARLMQAPASGGRSTALPIPLPGWHIHLFDISPDGRELLMRSDDRLIEPGPLWRVRIADGAATRIVPDRVLSARFSPDGKQIVWSTGETLYVAAIDGSYARQVAATTEPDLTVLFWMSADTIVLSREKERPSVPYGWGWGGFGASSAWVITPRGTGFARILPDWHRGHDFGGLTADGRFMLFVSAGALWSAPVSRLTGPRRLAGKTPVQISYGTPTVFVPHRTRSGRFFTIGDVSLGELQRFDPATRTWQRHLDGISADAVEYSRDGRWVAYVRYPEQSLWRCHADGTECLELVNGDFGAWLPHWSPDSQTIAFQAHKPGERWRMWLVNIDGSDLRLAAPRYTDDQCNAAWTADGKRIIFGSSFGYRFPTLERSPR